MKRRKTGMLGIVLVAATLALSSASIVSGETVQTKIGNTPKVWGFLTTGPAATRVVAMWQKKQTDIDVQIYGDQPPPNGLLIGVGWGKEDRLETVEFAPPTAGMTTFIVIDKVFGPPTKVWFNLSAMGSTPLSPLRARPAKRSGLAYIGKLDELAAEDPFFENIRQTLQRARKMKRSGR